MADCEVLEGCPFFNHHMESMPSIADLYRHKYCRTDSSDCARFIVYRSRGVEAVPGDLYPNDVARAKRVLAAPVL